MIKNLMDIIASPREAFERIKDNPVFFIPLLLVLAAQASVQLGYYYHVDQAVLLDQLVEQAMASGGVQESQIRESLSEGGAPNPMVLGLVSAIAVVVITPIVFALNALYLSIVSKFTNDGVSFKAWFSLVCWSTIPVLFAALAGWVLILSAGGDMALAEINPLSFNTLLFQTEGDFAGLLNNTGPITLWTLLLMILGYRVFTGSTVLKSSLVVLAPMLVIYGVWLTVAIL